MERKFLYLILAVVIVIIIVFVVDYGKKQLFSDSIVYSKEITQEEIYCSVDKDCESIQLSCCPNPYGSGAVSVNMKGISKISEWKEENCLKCNRIWDIDHFPFFYNESYCENNQCKKKSLPYCKSINIDCSSIGKEETIKKFSQIELDELSITAKEAVEACGC